MKRTMLLVFMFVLMMGTVLGCSSGTNETGSTNSDNTDANSGNGEEVTLQFSFWGNETHKKMYEKLFNKYKETHPNINVEIITVPFPNYQQKLSIMTASQTAPDVAWLAERMIPQFLNAGQLTDLSSELKSDSDYKFKDIYSSTLDLFQKDEKLYGVPFSTPPMILFYNKTLFEKNGLKTPTELYNEGKWDYQHFIQAAKKITDSSKGIYGVKFVREWKNWSDYLMPLIWSHGAKLFNEDKTQFTLNSPEGKKALQIYDDLIFKYEAHPKPGDQVTFGTGKIGMFTDRYSYVSKASEIKDFKWGIAPLPKGPAGRGASMGYAGYSVFKESDHKKEAIELLKFLTSKESMSVTSKFFVPSRKSILGSDVFKSQAPESIRDEIGTAVLDQMDKAKISPYHPKWQKIDVKMQKLLDLMYTQSASVEEMLNQMEQQIQPLMKK